MTTPERRSTVKETVINCLEAPSLRGVSTRHFIEFKRLRLLYEKQIEEKSRQLKEEIVPTSYRASIEDDDLRTFITAGWIEANSIDELTERQIQECVESRCHRPIDGEKLYMLEQAVRGVSMQMNITDAEDRVWTLHREYCSALRKAGYGDLQDAKPHITIDHILKKLRPPQLYRRMRDIIAWRKNDNFHKENFSRFMQEVAKQAEKIQVEQRSIHFHTDKTERTRTHSQVQEKKQPRFERTFFQVKERMPGRQIVHKEVEKEHRGQKRKLERTDAPLCLNPECRTKGERHYISQCPISSDETKTVLLEDFRRAKRARIDAAKRKDRKVGQVIRSTSSSHSALFKAIFANGTVEKDLMADQGADANFIDEQLLEQIQKETPSTKITQYNAEQVYRGVTGEPCLTCSKKVIMDVYLKIRHGSSLVLRNIEWKVARENIAIPIIGRRVLESIGCDNREMLMAARDKYGEEIDVAQRLDDDGNKEEESERNIAALFGESVFHSGGNVEEDGLVNEEICVDFGDDPPKEVENELKERIKEAVQNGLSKAGEKKLQEIIQRHRSVFRLRLGSGGPARVTAMKIRLEDGKMPVKVKVRKYPTDQRKFLDEYLDKLVKLDFIRPYPQAAWQAAPHLVPKNSKAKFRTTIDLRPVNAATIAEQWPMPVIEAELSDFKDSKHFASLDFCSGYWQCPLHPSSYEACGIIAPQGTFISTRVLHGLKNAAAYFQSTIPPLFQNLKNAVKAWIDDFIIHSKSENELLQHLCEFFETCAKHNLFLSAKKCEFYTKKVRWCGRIIDSKGYQLDPRNMEAIKTLNAPVNAAELCQFIHCCRWMSTSIPDMHRKMQPLNDMLEKAYKLTGKRRKSTLKNVTLDKLSWGAIHDDALSTIQDSLKQAVKLTFPKKDHATCVYTDASDAFWAAVVTQTKIEQLQRKMSEQEHEPLAFLGGKFTGSQKNWTTYEKEAYAIVQTFERLDYLFWGAHPVHVFTDHRNLLYVFAPIALRPNSPRHVLSKVHRWAIHLSRFEFVIDHIEGANNVFADILTRWSKGYRNTRAQQTNTIAALYKDIVPTASAIKQVNVGDILEEQTKYKPTEVLEKDENGLYKKESSIWIPDEATNLKLRIVVEGHCGERGHRAYEATLEAIKETYWWSNIKQDVREFTQACIHCIISRNGERIPRPLATAIHGEKPNEVIHMDFLYMGPAEESNMKYLLLIKDDLSSYAWLYPCERADSDVATSALAKWMACFGSMEWLVTDQGSHFVASLMTSLTQEARIRHHFTTAYCPWSNGTIERLCKEVLRVARALLSEWRLSAGSWTSIVEAIQKIMNQSPLKRLGTNAQGVMRCPMEVFTGLKASPLIIRPLPLRKYMSVKALDEARTMQVINIDRFHQALENIHKEVSDNNTANRSRALKWHNAKTNVTPLNINIGDYVMIRTHAHRNHKLESKWRGPMLVVEAKSTLVFVVKDINNGSQQTVHAQRMIPYPISRNATMISEELKQQATYYDTNFHLVQEICDIRERRGEFQVLIRWAGLDEDEDRTWEPIRQIRDDLPGVLEDYLHTSGKRNIKRNALDLHY